MQGLNTNPKLDTQTILRNMVKCHWNIYWCQLYILFSNTPAWDSIIARYLDLFTEFASGNFTNCISHDNVRPVFDSLKYVLERFGSLENTSPPSYLRAFDIFYSEPKKYISHTCAKVWSLWMEVVDLGVRQRTAILFSDIPEWCPVEQRCEFSICGIDKDVTKGGRLMWQMLFKPGHTNVEDDGSDIPVTFYSHFWINSPTHQRYI